MKRKLNNAQARDLNLRAVLMVNSWNSIVKN